MKFLDFKAKVQNMPVFWAKDISIFDEDEQLLRNQIRRWQAKGLLIKLRRGLYMLSENDRKITPSRSFIANQLYGPSYVSLEYALSLYGLIPERVADVTSVTTRKTQKFTNQFSAFIYKHIKRDCFKGFTQAKDETGISYFIALPEKAAVDFLYFNQHNLQRDFFANLQECYRFQNVSGLKVAKILEFARLFENRKLLDLSKSFCEFIKGER